MSGHEKCEYTAFYGFPLTGDGMGARSSRRDRETDLRRSGHWYADACKRCNLACELNALSGEQAIYTTATCQKWRRELERAELEKARAEARRARRNAKARKSV